jgi:hypothetical protein
MEKFFSCPLAIPLSLSYAAVADHGCWLTLSGHLPSIASFQEFFSFQIWGFDILRTHPQIDQFFVLASLVFALIGDQIDPKISTKMSLHQEIVRTLL